MLSGIGFIILIVLGLMVVCKEGEDLYYQGK